MQLPIGEWIESLRVRCTAPVHSGPERVPSSTSVIFMDVVPAPQVTTAPAEL